MRLLLVDGHYYAYRSFYAIRNLNNSRGEPTNMLYGFTKALKRMIQDVQPTYAAVIMDGGLPVERMNAQSDYKANRAETPADLVKQLPWLERLVPALGFAYLEVPGEEADDVIASYVQDVRPSGTQVVIATNDKDIMQMVDARTSIYQPASDAFKLLDVARVTDKWGVSPHLVGDVLRLTGDSVDNIPGVPGIGPKTAAALVRQFGTVDALMMNLSQVKNEKQRILLQECRELIERNRIMVSLRSGVPLPRPWQDLRLNPNLEAQAQLFDELEFKSFALEARHLLGKPPVPGPVDSPAPGQGELF